eukprot:11274221-Karenia_brevis.AAC.1
MHDEWHATATPENHNKLANYFARCLKELPLFHIRDMTLPGDDNPQPLDESTARGYAAWLQRQTDRAR